MVLKPERILSPELLSRLERFHFDAGRRVVGPWTGLHKSPHHGASVEFSEHKEYVAGDDIRRMDWRAYAKSDRYYIKRFEQETDLSALLCIDASASMNYHSGGISKLDYAALLAQSFCHIFLGQSDAVGCYIRNTIQRFHLPPSTQKTHLQLLEAMVMEMEGIGETALPRWVQESLELPGRCSVQIFISDCLCDAETLLRSLRAVAARNREVVLMALLDADELGFPFHLRTRFLDMESERHLTLDPVTVREDYLDLMKTHLETLRRGCAETGISFLLCNTTDPVEKTLANFFKPVNSR